MFCAWGVRGKCWITASPLYLSRLLNLRHTCLTVHILGLLPVLFFIKSGILQFLFACFLLFSQTWEKGIGILKNDFTSSSLTTKFILTFLVSWKTMNRKKRAFGINVFVICQPSFPHTMSSPWGQPSHSLPKHTTILHVSPSFYPPPAPLWALSCSSGRLQQFLNWFPASTDVSLHPTFDTIVMRSSYM